MDSNHYGPDWIGWIALSCVGLGWVGMESGLGNAGLDRIAARLGLAPFGWARLKQAAWLGSARSGRSKELVSGDPLLIEFRGQMRSDWIAIIVDRTGLVGLH